MNQYDFLGNLDIEDMIILGDVFKPLTMPQLLEDLDRSHTQETRPISYNFKRIYSEHDEKLDDNM